MGGAEAIKSCGRHGGQGFGGWREWSLILVTLRCQWDITAEMSSVQLEMGDWRSREGTWLSLWDSGCFWAECVQHHGRHPGREEEEGLQDTDYTLSPQGARGRGKGLAHAGQRPRRTPASRPWRSSSRLRLNFKAQTTFSV